MQECRIYPSDENTAPQLGEKKKGHNVWKCTHPIRIMHALIRMGTKVGNNRAAQLVRASAFRGRQGAGYKGGSYMHMRRTVYNIVNQRKRYGKSTGMAKIDVASTHDEVVRGTLANIVDILHPEESHQVRDQMQLYG